jgi:hypothetical protein
MMVTVWIGTIGMQGRLLRRLPHGMARIVAHGRLYTGRLV